MRDVRRKVRPAQEEGLRQTWSPEDLPELWKDDHAAFRGKTSVQMGYRPCGHGRSWGREANHFPDFRIHQRMEEGRKWRVYANQ